MKRSRQRIGAVLVAIAIVFGIAVSALAYWSANGSGTATTSLADTKSLTFAPGVPTAQLYPGASASVLIVATNANPYFVHVGALALDTDEGTPFVADTGHSGCDVSTLSFVTQDNSGEGWHVPPQAGSTDGTLAIDLPAAIHMSAAASSACQGATFTVHLEAGP